MTPLGMVLDTNVVLDAFVFDNRGVRPLIQAIESGTVHWLGCAEMRAELAHVLVHARLGDRQIDVERVLTSWDGLSQTVALAPLLPRQRLRCSDASDQMFIDLALTLRARWLLTRDRALLKLARKAAPQGLLIQPPEAWKAPASDCR